MTEPTPGLDPALFTIIGAAIAAGFGLLGAWIQGRREHHRWAREKRYEANLTFLKLVDRHQQRKQNKLGTPDLKKEPDVLAEMNDAVSAVALLGPESLIEKASNLRFAFAEYIIYGEKVLPEFEEARRAYIESTRRVVRLT